MYICPPLVLLLLFLILILCDAIAIACNNNSLATRSCKLKRAVLGVYWKIGRWRWQRWQRWPLFEFTEATTMRDLVPPPTKDDQRNGRIFFFFLFFILSDVGREAGRAGRLNSIQWRDETSTMFKYKTRSRPPARNRSLCGGDGQAAKGFIQ